MDLEVRGSGEFIPQGETLWERVHYAQNRKPHDEKLLIASIALAANIAARVG